MAKRGNLEKETESFLIAAQNTTIMTNYVKAKLHTMQQNSRCILCDDRHETINPIISEFSELAQKEYQTRHDCVAKVIHWELSEQFKFDHTNKRYMQKPESV